MPCYKCSNGKWRYGQHGKCVFDTESACRAAEQAIHARENPPKKAATTKQQSTEHNKSLDCGCNGISPSDFKG